MGWNQIVSRVVLVSLFTGGTLLGGTLEQVRKRGALQCGVSQGLPGFSSPDKKGRWKGIDVDFCHAVAAAVLGDSSKVKFIPLSSKERFTALQSGEVDLLSRNTTWTLARDSSLGVDWVGVTYFDGQGFMVRKDLKIKSAKELDGATICTNLGTTTELNIADFFRSKNMKYKLVTYEKTDETLKAYDAGRCDAYSTDQSGLYAMRLLLKNPKDHMILPDVISKEPLGPVVRHGDDQWLDVVKWVVNALIEAEEYGVTKANADKMAAESKNPGIRRLLGTDPGMGKNLGLDEKWALNAIKAKGNYGEIWEANIPPLGLPRGVNQLWSKGGIMYAPPVR